MTSCGKIEAIGLPESYQSKKWFLPGFLYECQGNASVATVESAPVEWNMYNFSHRKESSQFRQPFLPTTRQIV